VRFRRHAGTVVHSWRSPGAFTFSGQEWLRVELDNGMALTCRALEVRRL